MSKVPIVFAIIGVVVMVFLAAKFIPANVKSGFFSSLKPGFPSININNLKPGNSNNSQGSNSPEPTPSAKPGTYPETIIIGGPKEGDIVKDEPVVAFYFGFSGDFTKGKIYFETKVSGIDNQWQKIYSGARSFELLPGSVNYQFQVRACAESGFCDPSPTIVNFKGVISQKMGKVKIISAYPGNFPSSVMKVIVRNDSGSSVDLTGWTIEAGAGKFVFPKAVEKYDPSVSATNKNVVLENGDYAEIYGQSSPLDLNFKTNKCFGYLNKIYDFSLAPLGNYCPRPADSEIKDFSYSCRSYINGLGTCEIPKSNDLNKFADQPQCRSFAETRFNYSGCFNRYQFDNDFMRSEWRFYSGSSFIKKESDRLILRDASGLLVNSYSY